MTRLEQFMLGGRFINIFVCIVSRWHAGWKDLWKCKKDYEYSLHMYILTSKSFEDTFSPRISLLCRYIHEYPMCTFLYNFIFQLSTLKDFSVCPFPRFSSPVILINLKVYLCEHMHWVFGRFPGVRVQGKERESKKQRKKCS